MNFIERVLEWQIRNARRLAVICFLTAAINTALAGFNAVVAPELVAQAWFRAAILVAAGFINLSQAEKR